MQFILSVASFLGVVALLSGSVLAIIGLRSAPEGYEDESGFHVVGSQTEMGRDDVPCVGADTAVPF